MRTIFNKILMIGTSTLILLLAMTPGMGHAQGPSPHHASVDRDEAVAIADIWHAMELNSGYARVGEKERQDRLTRLQERQVLYLVSEDELLDTPRAGAEILAYVIEYEPTGFVVVSGDDRIEPIVVFSTGSEFRWDHPERNFLRHFLGRTMESRWRGLRTKLARGETVDVHPNWSYLRSRLWEDKSLEEITHKTLAPAAGSVHVLWDTPAWDQCGFYNDTVADNNGSNACVPTGCTATAMAIKMRFHRWPPAGGGGIHSYTDTDGSVQFSHSVDFSAQTYDWDTMPMTDLTSANADVADLMYHCGVAVDMNYEVGCGCTGGDASRAWPSDVAMNTYFGYKGTGELLASHNDPIRDSIIGGLPVVLSSSAHTVVADGYRDTTAPYFHINAGYGGDDDGWYALSGLPASDPTIDRSYPYGSPSDYVYVDADWSGIENGNIQNPYDTLSEGVAEVPGGGHLWMKAGTYTGTDNVPITIDKAMTIKAYAGEVTIGNPP